MMSEVERSEFLLSRPHVPIDDAARFVENSLVVQNQPPGVYSERCGKFITLQEGQREEEASTEMWQQADKEKEELFFLMEQVRAKFEDKLGYHVTSLDLRQCKWEQVMDEVHATGLRWRTSPTRSSRAMQCIDKIGQNSDAFESWIGLLPAGDYGTIIAGGFTIAISAASRYTKIEDEIFQALEEIPEMLEQSRQYMQIYADYRHSTLEKRTFHLFRSILRALIQIMQFFKDSTFRKISGSILKQGAYKENLLKSLDEVRKHAIKIQEEASQCHAWRTFEQTNMLQNVDNKTDQGLHMLQVIYQQLRTSENLLKTFGIHQQASELAPTQGNLVAFYSNSTLDDVPKSNRLASDQVAKQGSHRARKDLAKQSVKELLTILKHQHQIASTDVSDCLRRGTALGELSKARGAAMIQHAGFGVFMTDYLASSSLLVNGNADLADAEDLSPLSLIAANLVRISESMENAAQPVFVVKFFCSCHRPFAQQCDAPLPTTLMMNLIGQLIEQMMEKDIEIDLSLLSTSDWLKLDSLHLKALCDLFRDLTYQLPEKAVLLCVIDEISLYEIQSLEKETNTIIRRLTRLAKKHEDLVFKLLLTCQGRALGVSSYFAGHTIDLPTDLEPDDSSSWRISTMGTQGVS
ncbi:hypothetical protein F5Y18DRAFT_367148 [Xylariaceae sp. FL1019]|nr:hypothetical protein F5Y18DRAFT_367148 [Xylariaceae sp. FL1019]